MFKQSLKYLAISTIILSRTLPTIASCNDEAEPRTQNKIKPEFTIITVDKRNALRALGKCISADGSTIGGNVDQTSFIWTQKRGTTYLGLPIKDNANKNIGSTLFSMNFDGTVFLGGLTLSGTISNPYSCKWLADTNILDEISEIKISGTVPEKVTGMSGDGNTFVGYLCNGGYNIPYTWGKDVGRTILKNRNDGIGGSAALGTNFDGSVVVGYSFVRKKYNNSTNDDYKRATIWTNGAMISLDPDEIKGAPTHVSFTDSEAIATNYDGSVTIGYCYTSDAFTGFRYTLNDGMKSFGTLNGISYNNKPKAINGNGEVIVGSLDTTNKPFIWTPKTGIVSLENYLKPYLPKGVILEQATGVSADGSVVVGNGRYLESYTAFVWRAYLPEFKSEDFKFGAGKIVSDKLSIKPTQAEAN
ncbi:MAG: hypothetical protein BGO77_07195 [Caedibacter sp. 37-49]|nr:MAG: hypothetical protein BGO77_07195 [Caedibacter sp. 37-49]